jgi:hypothetical protein
MSTGNSRRFLGRSWPWGTAFWQEGYAVRAQIGREQARSDPGPSPKRRCADALRYSGLAAWGCVSVREHVFLATTRMWFWQTGQRAGPHSTRAVSVRLAGWAYGAGRFAKARHSAFSILPSAFCSRSSPRLRASDAPRFTSPIFPKRRRAALSRWTLPPRVSLGGA